MKKSITSLACASSLAALASLAAPFAERDVVRADGAWKMGREEALSISGRVVSSVDFDDAKWLPAKVPGTVLDNMVRNGLLPDPYFGTNNRRKLKAIPDLNDVDREYYSAWFRTEVEVPASFKGRKVWLRPEGINYRGEIWLNGTLVGETAGMFRRPVFDVTDVARPGGRNILAVKVRPVDFPGDPRPKTWGAAGEWRNGGNGDIGKNVTMLMSIGWDFTFSDGIRDRNTGIWKDVTLFATGPIRLDAPVVRTRFAGGSLDRAEIEAEVTVDNYLGRRTAGEVVEFEVEGTGVKQRARVDVRRGECAAVTFKAALDGPKLWWPRNKGGQNLYTAVFTAYSGEKDRENEVVDRVKVRFGVRETKSDQSGKDGARQFYVNGRRVFVRGTNWIPEAMLKTDDARMEAEVRLLAESGVNLVRLWGGGIAESDRFYELCDEYGLMVWQEFWMTGDTAHPQDRELYLACVADQLKRIRSHASIAHYVCSNESTETPGVRELIEKLDPTHSYMMQSECDGVHDGSPYKIVNPMRYYEDTASERGSRAYGFNPEYGTCALPDAEYLRTFMPEEMLWPIDREAWKYREGGGFDDMTTVHDAMVNAYGKSNSIDEYCRRSEAVDAMNHRALWEIWNRASATRKATGVLFWYANTPIPKIGSHAWDHSLGLTSAFFAQKSALAPLHAQYDYLDNTVSVMNDTVVDRTLDVVAEVFDFNSRRVAVKKASVKASAETCVDVFTLEFPSDITPVHFVRLALLDDGREIDSTVYWRSTSRYTGPKNMDGPTTAGFEAMDSLAKTTLEAHVARGEKGATISVRNAGDSIAFMVKILARDTKGRNLKPTFYSDNWFCLMPGESKDVLVEPPAGAAAWTVEAWNAPQVRGTFAAEETLAKMTFDFGSAGGIYATGDAKARIVPGGGEGSRGVLEIHHRTQKWNSGEFNLTGKVVGGHRCRFSAKVRQDAVPEGVFQLSLKIEDASGEHYDLAARGTGKKGEWKSLSGEFTVGADVKKLYPYIELYSSTDPFLIDDVLFVDLDAEMRDVSMEADLAPLKDAFARRGLAVGASVGDAVEADSTGIQKKLLLRHFGVIAPENQLKAQFLLDREASVRDLARCNEDAALDFSAPKPWFDFAKANGLRVNAQALVWFMLTPEWWFHEGYDEKKPLASRELMLKRMENYIRRVIGWCESEYPGIVRSWVVVNEAVDGDAKPHVRDDLFFRTIGEDYIAKAFEFAGMYRPETDCVMLYNDYNMEYYVEKMDFVLDYLDRYGLIERGSVNGIGFQCHLHMNWPGVSEIKKNCAKVAKAGLCAEVTEIDVKLGLGEVKKFASESAAFAKQGERYREIVSAFLSARDAGLDLQAFNWWGLTDAYTWLTDFHSEANFPLLFDRCNKAKPAYTGVMEALR